MLPGQSLGHQRHDGGAAAAEQDGADRHALGVFPLLGDDRALLGRGREARVRMRRRTAGAGVQGRRSQSMVLPGRCPHLLPPDVAIGGQRDVGEDAVALSVRIALWLLSSDVPGATPKKPVSGLMA